MMNSKAGVDLKRLCRICAVDVDDEIASHLLYENNGITELGEMFISCLGIQLMKDGYPERVCDYCHLQLNTFHAFVKKAKVTSAQFANLLKELIVYPISESSSKNDKNDAVLTISEMEFDVDTDNKPIRSTQNQLELDKAKVEIVGYDDDEYTVEYLEPEYMNNFEDEISQNSEEMVDDEELNEEDVEHQESADNAEHKENVRKTPKKKKPTKTANKSNTESDGDTPKSERKRSYPYRCKKCSKRFVYKEVYEAHIRIHKGLPGFSCPHCPKTFNEKSNFDYHMQDHTNYRPAKCDLCDKSFKNKQDLASHIRCHKDIRKYMCDVCGKRFRSQSHMAYHRYAHFDERNFHCDQCEQKFKSPHILRTHKNTVHSTVFRYECETCGRKFKRDHHLVAHRRTHTKVGRKPRVKKNAEKPQFVEVFEFVKEEGVEFDVDYVDEVSDSEFITAEVIEQ